MKNHISNMLRAGARFACNIFTTEISWMLYNIFFLIVYYIIFGALRMGDTFVAQDAQGVSMYRKLLFIVLVFVAIWMVAFFFIGRKALMNCKNLRVTILSVVISYLIIVYILYVLVWNNNYIPRFTNWLLFIVNNVRGCYFDEVIQEKSWNIDDMEDSFINNILLSAIPYLFMIVGSLSKKDGKTGDGVVS